jgi:Tfp pilus assembly PilM family ATPase
MLLLATYNFHNSLLAQTRDTEIVYSFIKEKIDEQYVSWHTHQDEKGKKRPKIQKVILAGEFDKPEELKEYLGKYLKLNVELAQVWQNIFSLEHHTPEVRFNDSLGYAVALGLALRPFDK